MENAVLKKASTLDLRQIPGLRPLLLLVGIAAAVALGVAVALWSASPSYGLLYSNLDEKDAAAVLQALDAADISYKLNNNSGAILVPAADVQKARLKLAAQGLPRGSNTGSDMVASRQGIGTSDFIEKRRYQQLLENDLSRTIASLDSVRAARVHLAEPKQSAFIRDEHPASASVLVNLYRGRQLDESQVAAIVHLVSSSVPNLMTKRVSVIDQRGNLLTSSNGNDALSASNKHFRFTQRLENAYAQRIETLLTPLIGAGKVRAQVVADLNYTRTEQTSEHYDPDHTALRSEQESRDQHAPGDEAMGIPGALSNQPPNTQNNQRQTATATQKSAQNQQTTASKTSKNKKQQTTPLDVSSSATRNYEIDRTVKHTQEPAGRIRRLSVAVVVDDRQVVNARGQAVHKPIGKAELAEMTALVKNAVGYDAARGDTVSVMNVAFQPPQAVKPQAKPPFWERPISRDLFKQGLGALLVIVLIFSLLRPLLKNFLQGSAASQPLLAADGPQALEEPEDDRLTLGRSQPAGNKLEDKLASVKRIAAQNPRQVAEVVKHWVAEDE